MAELSREEFARLCGDSKATLNTYIARKKVIVHGKKGELVDNSNPINKAHQKARQAFNEQKKESQQLMQRISQAKPVKLDKEPGEDGEDDELDGPSPEAMMALFAGNKGGRRSSGGGDDSEDAKKYFFMKMKGDAEYIALRVEREQMLLDKVAGKLIPTDMAGDVLRSHAKVIFSNMENALENIADVFCTITGAGPDIRARFVEEARGQLRTTISKAGADATAELDSIITNYADNRANKL